MNPYGDGKHEPVDPENAVRLLEFELMQQKMAREQAGTSLSWIADGQSDFFFAVVVGALLAFYYRFCRRRAGGVSRPRDAAWCQPERNLLQTMTTARQ